MKYVYITFQNGARICERVAKHMNNLIIASSQLHFTFLTWRPGETDFFFNVEYALYKGVKMFASIKKAMEKTVVSLNRSKKHLNQETRDKLNELLNSFEINSTAARRLIVRRVLDFMRDELSNIQRLEAFLEYFCSWAQPRIVSGTSEYKMLGILLNFYFCFRRFNKASFLFLEEYPQLLRPPSFFDNADAIYYFTSNFFESVILIGNVPHNKHLYQIAHSFTEARVGESFCPQSHLVGMDPETFVRNLESSKNITFDEEQRAAIARCARIYLNQHRFSAHSLKKGDDLMQGVPVTFFNRYHVFHLHTKIARDIIIKVKKMYLDIQEFISTILKKIFGERDLERAYQGVLKHGVQLYLTDCVEILSRCNKAIDRVRRKSGKNMEKYIVDIFALYVPYTSFGDARFISCQGVVFDFLAQHYTNVCNDLVNSTVQFIYNFTDAMSRLGYLPKNLDRTCIERLGQAMHMFQTTTDGLKKALKVYKKSGVIPGLHNLNQTVSRNNAFYDEIYKMVRVLPPRSPRVRPEVIIRMVPLNKELRGIIAKKMGPIFDGSEIELTTLLANFHSRSLNELNKIGL